MCYYGDMHVCACGDHRSMLVVFPVLFSPFLLFFMTGFVTQYSTHHLAKHWMSKTLQWSSFLWAPKLHLLVYTLLHFPLYTGTGDLKSSVYIANTLPSESVAQLLSFFMQSVIYIGSWTIHEHCYEHLILLPIYPAGILLLFLLVSGSPSLRDWERTQ